MPHITKDQRDSLLIDYSNGISVFIIAKKYNVHFTYPSKAAKRAGLELRGNEQRSLKRKSSRRWQSLNSEKRAAHKTVEWALMSGKLIKKPCECCGSDKSQAHHEDYSKPLDVNWLCSKHHRAKHILETALK